MKTTLVLQEWINSGEIPPSKFYVKNLYGDYIFIHAKTLKEARQFAREQYPTSEVESSKLAHSNTRTWPMCNHHLTATIYDKRGRVLSIGHNSYVKTHTIQAKYAAAVGLPEKQFIHAEMAAILKCRNLDKAYRIMVTRFNKKGEPLCAKPCKICMEAIRDMTDIQVIQHT